MISTAWFLAIIYQFQQTRIIIQKISLRWFRTCRSNVFNGQLSVLFKLSYSFCLFRVLSENKLFSQFALAIKYLLRKILLTHTTAMLFKIYLMPHCYRERSYMLIYKINQSYEFSFYIYSMKSGKNIVP